MSTTNATNGRELWRGDGMAAGTVRVAQVSIGSLAMHSLGFEGRLGFVVG